MIINEVYPSPKGGDHEWVELYNNEEVDIDLSVYSVTDDKGKKLFLPHTPLLPNSYVLATSSSVLNNTGDTVYLLQDNLVIDKFSYSESISEAHTYTLCSSTWIVTDKKTPQGPNDSACAPTTNPTEDSPSTTLVQKSTPYPSQKTITHDKIIISEYYPFPSNGENEWVELYNNHSYTVDLQNWQVDDIAEGGSSPHTFSLTLLPNEFAVVYLSKNMFNNTGDTLRLINNMGDEVFLTKYEKAKEGLSIGRHPQEMNVDSYCPQYPSPQKQNNECIVKTVVESDKIEPPSINNTSSQSPQTDIHEAVEDGIIFETISQNEQIAIAPTSSREAVLGALHSNSEKKDMHSGVRLLLAGSIFSSLTNLFLLTPRLMKPASKKGEPTSSSATIISVKEHINHALIKIRG